MRAAIICPYDANRGQPPWPLIGDANDPSNPLRPLITNCWAMQLLSPQPGTVMYGVNEDEATINELLTYEGFVLEEVLRADDSEG
jgi:hypothetical protein